MRYFCEGNADALGLCSASTPLAPTLHSWRVFNPDLEVDHQRIPITSEGTPLGVESRSMRCEARTRRRAKKLDPRFLKLGKSGNRKPIRSCRLRPRRSTD